MSNEISLEALGLSREDLIDRLTEKVFERLGLDDEFDSCSVEDRIRDGNRKQLDQAVRDAVQKIGDETVAPQAEQLIREHVFQKTNEWGEPKGDPMTMTEILAKCAQDYMSEPVNLQGKTKSQDSYQFRAHTTRLGYMIERHIAHQVEKAMKETIANANMTLAQSITDTVKFQLGEIMGGIKTSVEVKR